MSMNVWYKVFDKGNEIYNSIDGACFSRAYGMDCTKNYSAEVLIKSAKKNVKYINFWINLLLNIDPSLEFYSKNKNVYMRMSLNNKLKFKIISTILRFLWEDSNHYDPIVKATMDLYEVFPNIDPLIAVTIANSCAKNMTGYGHSLISGTATELLKTSMHYRAIKGDGGIHSYLNSNYVGGNSLKRKILNQIEDTIILSENEEYEDFLTEFYIKEMKVDVNYKKLYTYPYGSVNFNRRFSWDGEIKKYCWTGPSKDGSN